MSDSDRDSGNSGDSEREKRLQLARYRKRYRNAWDYVTYRWYGTDICIVLDFMEEQWSYYASGRWGELKNISGAFRFLEEMYLPNDDNNCINESENLCLLPDTNPSLRDYLGKIDFLESSNLKSILGEYDDFHKDFCEKEYGYFDLIAAKKRLLHDLEDISEYVKFFEEVAELNYGRKARHRNVGGIYRSMRIAISIVIGFSL